METAAKRRVLFVITKANWGGAQRYVFDLAVATRDRGYAVGVVTGASGMLSERLAAEGIDTFPISAMGRDVRLLAEVRSFAALLRTVRAFRPDVLHGNSSKAGALAGLAGRLLGVRRIVFTAHGWAFNERRPAWQKAVIWTVHAVTVALSHVTLCVSDAVRRDARHMPFARSRLRVVRNAVRDVPLVLRADARTHLAPEWDADAFWVGTIAELHPTKGIDVLLRAFARLVQTHPEARLAVLGEGQERADLETLASALGLEGSVRFMGFVPDARSYLRAFDAFALASRSEALGYVLLEAGSAGVAGVATRVGGVPEVVEDEVTGLLVDTDDPAALARALERLAADSTLRERLGGNLRERVAQDFSLQRMVDATFEAYR